MISFDIPFILDYYGIYYEEKPGTDDVVYLCPFHDDDHLGSALFNVDTGLYNCFACHEGGFVTKFVSLMSNVDIQKAEFLINTNFNTGDAYDLSKLTTDLQRGRKKFVKSKDIKAIREIGYKILQEISISGVPLDLLKRWYPIFPMLNFIDNQNSSKYKLIDVVEGYNIFSSELTQGGPHGRE